MTQRIRVFLLFEAAAFVTAALVHFGVPITGYEHVRARVPESDCPGLARRVGCKLDSPGVDPESWHSRSGVCAIGDTGRRDHGHRWHWSANGARHHLPYRHRGGADLGCGRRSEAALVTSSSS